MEAEPGNKVAGLNIGGVNPVLQLDSTKWAFKRVTPQ